MFGEFGEVSGIIDLVINFLAAGTLFLNSYDTLSYIWWQYQNWSTYNLLSNKLKVLEGGVGCTGGSGGFGQDK